MRCPRCKHSLQAGSPEALADDMLAHLRDAHGHEPPREHVLARIALQRQEAGNE
jgi:predicted small metal-binding protein